VDAALALLIILGSLAAILIGLAGLARRVRRGGVGARLMGPIDEVFNPGAHWSRQVIEVQDERMEAPASADDQLRRD
jgi:hypothetical protein